MPKVVLLCYYATEFYAARKLVLEVILGNDT